MCSSLFCACVTRSRKCGRLMGYADAVSKPQHPFRREKIRQSSTLPKKPLHRKCSTAKSRFCWTSGQAGASGRGRTSQGRCAGTAGLNYRFEFVVQRNTCGRSAVPFFTEMVGINSKKSSTLLQMESQNQSKRKIKDPAQLSSIWQNVYRRTWHE